VRAARSRIEREHLNNVSALITNAENIGFPDCSFDFAFCGFMGWEYCFDFKRSEFWGQDRRMMEISRVLRDGGQVGISSWLRQEDLDWMEEKVIQHYPAILVDRDFISNRPIGYSREGAEGYKIILQSAGFKEFKIVTEEVEFVSKDVGEWWEQMESVGWLRFFRKIENEHADIIQELKANILLDLQHQMQTDDIRFVKSVVFIYAKKG